MKLIISVRNLEGITVAMTIAVALLSVPGVCLAEDAFIVVRDEPPRVAYRKLTPGPATAVDTSPAIAMPMSLAPVDLDVTGVARELSEAEVASIAAFVPVNRTIDRPPLEERAFSTAHYRRGGIAGVPDRALPASTILHNKEGVAGYPLATTIHRRTDVADAVLRAVMSRGR